MNCDQKRFLLIGSSGKKIAFQKIRQDVSIGNKGDPLGGIKYDLDGLFRKYKRDHMIQKLETSEDQNALLPKAYIINKIQKYIGQAEYEVCIFYTGHGHEKGDWAIETLQNPKGDRITLEQIIDIWLKSRKSRKANLAIFMDSCYSGGFCYRLEDKTIQDLNISIYASCKDDETAKDCKGGLLFKCLYDSDQNFDQNCALLYKKQTPLFIKYGEQRVAKLEKQVIRSIRNNIINAYPSQKPIKPIQEYTAQQLKQLLLRKQKQQLANKNPINPPPVKQQNKIIPNKQQAQIIINPIKKQQPYQPMIPNSNYQIPQNVKNNMIINNNKTINALDWVDNQSYYFKDMQIKANSIRNKSSQILYIFSKLRIRNKNIFNIQFVNINQMVGVGIIDEKSRKQSSLLMEKNKIYYENCSRLHVGTTLKTVQGGYKKGEVITIIVSIERSQIIWQVGNQIRFDVRNDRISDRSIEWVPLIALYSKDDEVKIL